MAMGLNLLKDFLGPIGLDPGAGYDKAAQGAANADARLSALSDLQYRRQMSGLGGALNYVNGLQDLYNSMYGPGRGQVAPGGGNPLAPPPAPVSTPVQPRNMNQTSPVGGAFASALGTLGKIF